MLRAKVVLAADLFFDERRDLPLSLVFFFIIILRFFFFQKREGHILQWFCQNFKLCFNNTMTNNNLS